MYAGKSILFDRIKIAAKDCFKAFPFVRFENCEIFFRGVYPALSQGLPFLLDIF